MAESSFLSWCSETASSRWPCSTHSRGRSAFQWGASISAMYVFVNTKPDRAQIRLPSISFGHFSCSQPPHLSLHHITSTIWKLARLSCCYCKPLLSSHYSSFSVPILHHHTQLAG